VHRNPIRSIAVLQTLKTGIVTNVRFHSGRVYAIRLRFLRKHHKKRSHKPDNPYND